MNYLPLKWVLACLLAGLTFSAFAVVPAIIVSNNVAQPVHSPVPVAPAQPADTNFIDPALTGDNPQIKQLNDELAKEGVKPENFMDQHFLWASMVWSAIAGGYLLYAKKQREVAPLIGGVGMVAASFLVTSWFWMSIICIALIVGTHWLLRNTDI